MNKWMKHVQTTKAKMPKGTQLSAVLKASKKTYVRD
jgi:hypothetical protein